MTALASAQGADRLGDVTSLTDGYSAAFLGAAGIAVVGAALAAALLRSPKAEATAATEAREQLAA
jgi:ribosomal protein L9